LHLGAGAGFRDVTCDLEELLAPGDLIPAGPLVAAGRLIPAGPLVAAETPVPAARVVAPLKLVPALLLRQDAPAGGPR
jgi:hypothetical protein